MTHHNDKNSKMKNTPKRIFVSHARVLSEEKHKALSEQEKTFEKNCQDRGIWLELFCPDDVCLTEGERIGIPVFCEDPKVKKSILLNILCPGDSCEVYEATKIP